MNRINHTNHTRFKSSQQPQLGTMLNEQNCIQLALVTNYKPYVAVARFQLLCSELCLFIANGVFRNSLAFFNIGLNEGIGP